MNPSIKAFHLFHVTDLFWYPLKTSESQRLSDVLRGYRKRSVAWNGLKNYVVPSYSLLMFSRGYEKYWRHSDAFTNMITFSTAGMLKNQQKSAEIINRKLYFYVVSAYHLQSQSCNLLLPWLVFPWSNLFDLVHKHGWYTNMGNKLVHKHG